MCLGRGNEGLKWPGGEPGERQLLAGFPALTRARGAQLSGTCPRPTGS